jgi:hypothetical protein
VRLTATLIALAAIVGGIWWVDISAYQRGQDDYRAMIEANDKERLDAIQDVAPSADLDAARERLCRNAGLANCPM